MNWKKTIRIGLLWAAVTQLAIAGKPAAAGLFLPENLPLENRSLENRSFENSLLENSLLESFSLESSLLKSSSLKSSSLENTLRENTLRESSPLENSPLENSPVKSSSPKSSSLQSAPPTESPAFHYTSGAASAVLALKTPGNPAKRYPLTLQPLSGQPFPYQWIAAEAQPLLIYQQVAEQAGKAEITLFLTATADVYFHLSTRLSTGYPHDDCLFLLPGFWYRRNLRSPREAPSCHTSDSWTVREDRLSTPLAAIYHPAAGKALSVLRLDTARLDALATHPTGETILSGPTSLGYTGFENCDGTAALSFGFPYQETPKTYLRKLTLAPPTEAYQFLRKGESLTLRWEVRETPAADYSDCVANLWQYSYDSRRPAPVATPYTPAEMKQTLSRYFTASFVDTPAASYYAGVELRVADPAPTDIAEVGFIGRTLLNAFNALEYGETHGKPSLAADARRVIGAYEQHGFSAAGFFHEVIHPRRGFVEKVHSIRRQSEGAYALLYYLRYEKEKGRRHPALETRIRTLLDNFLALQQADGSFPRKFTDNLARIDSSGGSTPSATLPLAMAYRYFGDKRYLDAARRSVHYLEKELISKADYFSSTLDANCEDKEASLYASTAAYYLALATRGDEQRHLAALSRKAAYFALSWYYTWDVPFAPGQMLGDMGLRTRGWGNVSVENNHIDVFIFDFADVLHWLGRQLDEPRFPAFAEVISTSMRQLLPAEGHLCGVGAPGYYPEVVQHTAWDYGKNGKGYYNDIFAPGWTVASLWELFSPGRAEAFFRK